MGMSAEHSLASNRYVAHHFDSPQQQMAAGKLGMWIFLVTEVLFFSGLFVAYAVYRSWHPQVFADAHRFLSTELGTLNTVVLLFSSLTMAWSVRCAQLNQQRGLLVCLATTLACAGMFLGVKAVEYSLKWEEGLLWAGAFAPPKISASSNLVSAPLLVLSAPALSAIVAGAIGLVVARRKKWRPASAVWAVVLITGWTFCLGVAVAAGVLSFGEHADVTVPAETDHAVQRTPGAVDDPATAAKAINFTGVFFSIYYVMTGVHALHILGGMAVIAWLVWGAAAGKYGAQYFNPVDYVGLYWHLVDVVWIFLFPLLYLIR